MQVLHACLCYFAIKWWKKSCLLYNDLILKGMSWKTVTVAIGILYFLQLFVLDLWGDVLLYFYKSVTDFEQISKNLSLTSPLNLHVEHTCNKSQVSTLTSNGFMMSLRHHPLSSWMSWSSYKTYFKAFTRRKSFFLFTINLNLHNRKQTLKQERK